MGNEGVVTYYDVFLSFRASPRVNTVIATIIPSKAPIIWKPPGPGGCSTKVPIKYPVNAARIIPIIASSTFKLFPPMFFFVFSFYDLCKNLRLDCR